MLSHSRLPSIRRCRAVLASGAAVAALFGNGATQAQSLSVTASLSDNVHQRLADAPAQASVPASSFAVNVPASTTSANLDENDIGANADGNRAIDDLILTVPTAFTGPATASVTTAPSGLRIGGGIVAASLQGIERSPVTAEVLGADFALRAAVLDGLIGSIRTNRTSAVAGGNTAANAVSVTIPSLRTGVAAVTGQAIDAASAVSATQAMSAVMTAGEVRSSELQIARNVVSSRADGNVADLRLAVSAPISVTGLSRALPSWLTKAQDGSSDSTALLSAVTDQREASSIIALTAANEHIGINTTIANSALEITGNSAFAGSGGNRAATSLLAGAASISRQATPSALATLTISQRLAAPLVEASVNGTAHISGGGASASDVMVLANERLADAVGNAAQSNLRVESASLDLGAPVPPVGLPVPRASGIPGYVIGTALETAASLSASAPIALQSFQDVNAASIVAETDGAIGTVTLTGPANRSTIELSSNTGTARAAANVGKQELVIDATTLRTAADLNAVQRSAATVDARTGSGAARTGATVALAGQASELAVDLKNNVLTADASGNSMANQLSIRGASLTNGSGHVGSQAGALFGGTGAAAEYALSGGQDLGSSDYVPILNAEVTGRFAVEAHGALDRAMIDVASNRQSATTLGNSANNRVNVSGATIGSAAASLPGAALSSRQTGQARLSAISQSEFVVPPTATNAVIAVIGNTNSAAAFENVADNRLTFSAASVVRPRASEASGRSSDGSGAYGDGDVVLANSQSAAGAITAATRTQVGSPSTTLGQSSLTISANEVNAEAVANQALNAIEFATSGGGAATGLNNAQFSTATVSANAQLMALTPGAASSNLALSNNSAAARAQGNVANNALRYAAASGGQSGPLSGFDSGAAVLPAHAAVMLRSDQVNIGAITAGAESTMTGTVLNGPGAALAINANHTNAAAVGNTATNQLVLPALSGGAGGLIAASQVNCAPVTASVSANHRFGTGTSGATTLSGNTASASAIGNLAFNRIVAGS